VEIYSIGFTQKNALQFFGTLKAYKIERLLDVRLNNSSQLAGFAKVSDLPYFLREICHADYEHEPLLAPTQDILDAFKKMKGDWSVYTEAYLSLIRSRKVEEKLDRATFERRTVLLCSEATAEHCHRRLALEHLQQHWDGVIIRHL
jgi:uncharacterized protein (DUF488 family)